MQWKPCGRTYLKARAKDAADAILSAVGYNFRHIFAWLRHLFVPNPGRGAASRASQSALNPASGEWTTNSSERLS
jgi:hypothetical protein